MRIIEEGSQLNIPLERLKARLKKIATWKTHGLDGIPQGEDQSNPKDTLKGTAPTNYRPITFLPMILTAQIKERIYNSLISLGIFPEE